MTTPKVLRIVRPYQTQVEFIAAESWAIQKDGLIALGEPELPIGTLVRCEIGLASGLQLIRVEGEVEGYAPAKGGRPGGPKLRIRRVTPSSKEFILTVLRARRASLRPIAGGSEGESRPVEVIVAAEAAVLAPPLPTSEARKALSNRPVSELVRPPNRDELLEQLRERSRSRPTPINSRPDLPKP